MPIDGWTDGLGGNEINGLNIDSFSSFYMKVELSKYK
jgi:hypothetical protein